MIVNWKLAFTVVLLIISHNCYPQNGSIFLPKNIQNAFAKKTRSLDGSPGIVYWQNRADYKINISLNPKNLLITGKETITYSNNSPDTLRHLIFHLFPNMYKKGNMRDEDIDPADESEGLIIDKISVNGKDITISPNSDIIYVEHTLLRLRLAPSLLPQKQVSVDISWHYTLNRNSHIRTGAVDSTTFFLAYFFPRIAVYDDIDGWNYYKYTNDSEFYNDFGNFDVSVAMPKNYLVWATGILKNPEEVLNEKYLNRYKAVSQSNVTMRIVDTTDLKLRDFTIPNDLNIWKFKAENVTDFAIGTSDHYLWDATSLIVDSKTGRKMFLDVAYNKDSKDFYKVISVARQSIELMSNSFPGVPFPFPKETIFNGLSEMEYPMMVNNRSYEDIHSTIDLTVHEIFHSYFPFYCGFNEVSYAWMDEGITSLATYFMVSVIDPGYQKVCFIDEYRPYIGTNLDLPVFTNSSSIRRPVYDFISYPKPALFFIFLKDVLGEEVFKKTIQEFISRWNGKHPLPYDLFNTIANVSGKNVDWLIKPWIFEYGYVDLGVKDVIEKNNKYFITIERRGNYPSPVSLKFIYQDNSTEINRNTAEVWKNGENLYTIEKPNFRKIKIIELVDEYGIDINPSNNSFTLNGWKINHK